MYQKLVKIGVGGAIFGAGIGITAALSPLLLLSGPVAAMHTYKKIKSHPGINNPEFEADPIASAIVLADCTLHGLKLAIEPLRGSLDIAMLGAVIIVES